MSDGAPVSRPLPSRASSGSIIESSGANVRIAVVEYLAAGYGRGILRGVRQYALQRANWVLFGVEPGPELEQVLDEWQPTALIARLGTRATVRAVCRPGRAVVNVSNVIDDLPVPRVAIDGVAVGELAAGYFLARGFRNFAYVGYADARFAHQQLNGYRRILRASGHDCAVHPHDDASVCEYREPWNLRLSTSHATVAWLASLPKPIAILAAGDPLALRVAEAAARLGLRIPEDVALLGVDDDRYLCELAPIPLSSVAVPAERTGYEAAALLDRLLAGEAPAQQDVLLPPSGVVTRRSSDVIAIDEPHVASAVRFIREHVHETPSVEAIASAAGLSVRALQLHFRRHLGRSPFSEIRRVQIERAQQLLTGTRLTLPLVARQSGFANAHRLSAVFRKHVGVPPGQYRQRHQTNGSSISTDL